MERALGLLCLLMSAVKELVVGVMVDVLCALLDDRASQDSLPKWYTVST